jgi:gluconate 2-dehydrogenase gamma chain
MLQLAAALPRGWQEVFAAPASEPFRFFQPHQADVVREATARLIPGPEEDPLEIGHAGAREANVVRYIDLMLSAFTVDPPLIHAGGPWSDRSGGETNYMASFVPLSETQAQLWRRRIEALQEKYLLGIKALDAVAGGDFTIAPALQKDQILFDAGEFRDLLFTHAIEGFLSVPEYGGNEDLAGWREIRWPGDSQPRGYTPDEVSFSDGLNPLVLDEVVTLALANFGEAVAMMLKARGYGR